MNLELKPRPIKMSSRKKKTSTKNGKTTNANGKAFAKEENNIAVYFKKSSEMQKKIDQTDVLTIDLTENGIEVIVSPLTEAKNSQTSRVTKRLPNQVPTNIDSRRSISVPPNKISSKTNKLPLDASDQSRISDYFVVRRSGRTSREALKKKEKEELESLILNKTRELGEEHLKVVDIPGKGRGVLASRSFCRGEFIVEYAGDLIELSLAKQRESQYKLSPTYGCYMYYFSAYNRQYCVDATAETSRLGRLVNHSRLRPNCATKVVDVRGSPRLILVALKQIESGEELLYDYGDRQKESISAHPWLAF